MNIHKKLIIHRSLKIFKTAQQWRNSDVHTKRYVKVNSAQLIILRAMKYGQNFETCFNLTGIQIIQN